MRTKRRSAHLEARPDSEEIIRFAVRWHPYQGADASEVLLCFGISMRVFGERLRYSLTESAHGVILEADMRRVLLKYADELRR